jgi:hypothetical protein
MLIGSPLFVAGKLPWPFGGLDCEARLIPIHSKGDLAEAATQVRAFLFLYVNWAIHAQKSMSTVEAVAATWDSSHPSIPAPCYIVDVSEQSGEVWDALADLLKNEERPVGLLMMSGGGPLLWVHEGHIAAHVFPNHFGREKLVAVSRSIWL